MSTPAQELLEKIQAHERAEAIKRVKLLIGKMKHDFVLWRAHKHFVPTEMEKTVLEEEGFTVSTITCPDDAWSCACNSNHTVVSAEDAVRHLRDNLALDLALAVEAFMQKPTDLSYDDVLESMTKSLSKSMRFTGALDAAVQRRLCRAGFAIAIERNTAHCMDGHGWNECNCRRRVQTTVSIASATPKKN